MGDTLHFGNREVRIRNYINIAPNERLADQLLLQFDISSAIIRTGGSARNVYDSQRNVADSVLSGSQLAKPHIRLGRAIVALFRYHSSFAPENRPRSDDATIGGRPCFNSRYRVISSVAPARKSLLPGCAVSFDFFFVDGGVVAIASLYLFRMESRSIAAHAANPFAHLDRLKFLFSAPHTPPHPPPRFVIRDGRPATFSAEWADLANTHNICVIMSPHGCAAKNRCARTPWMPS